MMEQINMSILKVINRGITRNRKRGKMKIQKGKH